MAEMNRNQQQGGNRRGDQGMGSNRDTQSRRDQQQSGRQQQDWDGNERRTGAERRTSYGSAYDSMEMNEGSSR